VNFLPHVLRYTAAAVCLLLTVCSLAATPLLRPLTPDQGLSQGSVRDMLLDQHGFLWLATEGGLNRYDSNQVVQLRTAKYRLREVSFTRLLRDSDNQILAATSNGDLYRYDNQSGLMQLFSQLNQQYETLKYSHITGLVQHDTDFLLMTTSHALYRISRLSGKADKLFDLTEQGEPDSLLRDLLVYQHYVIMASYNGVIVYDMHSGQHHYLPHVDAQHASADQRHTKVLSVQHDKLWIGTVAGLYSIELSAVQAFLQQQQPYQVKTEITELNIWQILWSEQNAVIPTEKGLFRFSAVDGNTVQLLKLTDASLQLSDDTIINVLADNDGGYWLASRDNGAYYWHPRSQAFNQISRTDGGVTPISNDKIFSIVATSENELWLGTANGLNKLDIHNGVSEAYFVSADAKAVAHEGSINAIFAAANGKLWLHTSLGLRLFDRATKQYLPLPGVTEQDKSLFDHMSYSYFSHQQNLYFFRLDNAFRYDTNTGEVADITQSLAQIGTDNLAIVAELNGAQGGLILSKPDEIWLWQPDSGRSRMIYRHADYRPQSNRIADTALLDTQNRLWVGISGIGLLAFDATSLELVQHITVADSLLSDAVYGLQQDSAGSIWFASHKGLARLQPESLQLEFFTRDDGLATHEYNGGAAAILHDGTLVFGSMRGLTLVNPDLLTQQTGQPLVSITGISVLNGEFAPLYANLNNRHIKLSHQDLGVRIQFSAMNFNSNHKVRYRYWLSGGSDVSYPRQANNSVVFPQLSHGDYQFHVVSISPHNGKESPAATLNLTIAPAPWLSQQALLAYLLILVFAIYRFYRFRRRQSDEINAAHKKLQLSAQRLKQALASVNSGAWEWNADTNMLFATRIHSMLGYSEQMNPLPLPQHIGYIHPDDSVAYTSQWQHFLREPESGFDCTYRLQHQQGQWLWFRDLGKATEFNQHNQPEKVIGTYSNITETRANQEKARLFGEAFQQTRDWVVILDHNQQVIAANQSFATAFGNIEQYLEQPRLHHLGISLVRRRFYTKLLQEMASGEHWQGEELVITPDGRERPTLINISAIGEQQQTFFVLVFTDITAQKQAEDELRYLANYDALTGLPNRALLMDRIYHGIDQAKRAKRTLALCFIDLDKFKQINDSLGHDIGDLLLKEVARRLTLTLRESDTVARLGGDEFVVLLEGYKKDDNISHVARKMLSVISEPMVLASNTVGVSPSIGIAVYPDDAVNATELLKHADVAMYHAKDAGRNNFQFFTAEMNEKAHMRLARETRLRKALHNDEFINYYQPIVNSQTRQVVGVEVLLRWQSTEGMISPVDFIPLAEELRLIIKMTDQLLERALSDLKNWHNNGHLIYLSVNLSPQHLEQPVMAENVRDLLKKYDIPASCLRFEVTENALMRDHQSAIDTMLSLSFLGAQLALDDFGTGYSSLKYLKELPIDGIKIDRSFVQDIGIDSSDETIIDAMLSMANSLGMYCVAEGVETEQQLAFFSQRNCYLIQGYLFAKPMPADALLEFLQQETLKVANTAFSG
jgi:diguanylate cyclase (GGDEF)-like protein/PAS domain S-box-containing protein